MTSIDVIERRVSAATPKNMWEAVGAGVVRIKYGDGSFSEFRLKAEDADFVIHAVNDMDQLLLSHASALAECDRLKALIDSDLAVRVDNLRIELSKERSSSKATLAYVSTGFANDIKKLQAQIDHIQNIEQAARAVCSPEITPLLQETDSRATRAMNALRASLKPVVVT